jgi:septum formation protein
VAPLILASTSRYRHALLSRLAVAFTAEAPECDEDALKIVHADATPQQLAERLALAKAVSLRTRFPAAIIIGSDQLAELDGDILGKPGTRAAALAQLERLNGRQHRLITAVAISTPERVLTHTDVTQLHMRALSLAQLERYVDADQPLDCAGSYKLEAAGISLFARIDSADHSAITGLPLLAVTRMLAELGFTLP